MDRVVLRKRPFLAMLTWCQGRRCCLMEAMLT